MHVKFTGYYYSIDLRRMDNLHVLSPYLQEGTIFVVSCLLLWVWGGGGTDAFRDRINSYSKDIAPGGANSFLLELICIGKGGKYEMAKLLPLDIPGYLNSLKILFPDHFIYSVFFEIIVVYFVSSEYL